MASASGEADKPSWALEVAARREGFRHIAGTDEAGRGCLFGPVFAAAVILDPDEELEGLDDSKRLTAGQRLVLDRRIRETAVAFAVRATDAATIDLINILQASRLAMEQAIEALEPTADFVLVDAVRLEIAVQHKSVVRGDRISRSIAAASILAKVARDRCMEAWDSAYPEYGLAKHKGYPAPAHVAALRTHGCTPLHRRSFSPVARIARPGPRAPARALAAKRILEAFE